MPPAGLRDLINGVDNQTKFCTVILMEFEWDPAKAEANIAKHGIAFLQAIGVFLDPARITEADTRKDYGEPRETTIGFTNAAFVTAVTHTDRAGIIRLISDRPASRQERKRYYGKNNQSNIGGR